IIDVNSNEVVALHFAGEYLKGNYAVPMYELARDARVAPKLNFQNTISPTNDWEPAWRRVLNAEGAIPSTSDSPVSAPIAPYQPPTASDVRDDADLSVTWNIPLRVTLSLGRPSGEPGPAHLPSQGLAGMDVQLSGEEAVVVEP